MKLFTKLDLNKNLIDTFIINFINEIKSDIEDYS